jgi:hypothetical protein
LLSVNGTIPRIDSSSSIVRTTVISRGKTFGLTATDEQLLQMFSSNLEMAYRGTFLGD